MIGQSCHVIGNISQVQREIYLSQIKIWLLRCEEELYNINSELPMLEHRDKLRGGHVTSKPPIKPKVLTTNTYYIATLRVYIIYWFKTK